MHHKTLIWLLLATTTLFPAAYHLHEDACVLPNKKGYAIVPHRWPHVTIKDDQLRYHIKGQENLKDLPVSMRRRLQKEYEHICQPSSKANVGDLNGVFGPLNVLREKEHTLWIFPVYRGDDGHALVFVQNLDGTFCKGCVTLGLKGGDDVHLADTDK